MLIRSINDYSGSFIIVTQSYDIEDRTNLDFVQLYNTRAALHIGFKIYQPRSANTSKSLRDIIMREEDRQAFRVMDKAASYASKTSYL